MQDMATFHSQLNAPMSSPSPGSVAKPQEMRSKLPTTLNKEDFHVRNGKEGFESKNEMDGCTVIKNDSAETDKPRDENETQYICPICDTALSTQHELTLHIRSHNNDAELSNLNSSKGFTCRICGRVLGSASSLDRHVLVHSGERPHRCYVCGLLFKTNGNMHRHIRTAHYCHGKVTDSNTCNESDSSSDSNSENQKTLSYPNCKRKRLNCSSGEFNNNSIDLPSKLDRLRDTSSTKSLDYNSYRSKNELESQPIQWFTCPVCSREDFSTLHILENHIDEYHPDYKVKCHLCNLEFSNHKKLNLHRSMKHLDHNQKSNSKGMVGFKDLTFIDFSSEKFPYIAKAVCEQKLHKSNSPHFSFQCEKCHRAFPCADALTIHQQSCLAQNYSSSIDSFNDHGDISSSENEAPTDLSHKQNYTNWNISSISIEEEKERHSFFAGLDLQNRSISSSPSDSPTKNQVLKRGHIINGGLTENKDLADIQSIINVTSANFMTDLSKSPQPSSLEVTPPDSGSRNYDLGGEEEQQDCFAAEFRKMKLQGKFPCRLCSSVFTNLRALKGHNRSHLTNSPSNGVYYCNMCPHHNTDKAALIRHMRTHNGERPYQCSVCRYAFTTKANCERHLKNRHAKMSREEVKNSIIYHPSEDSTNNIPEIKQCSREDVKRLLFAEISNTSIKPEKEADIACIAKCDNSPSEIFKESPDRSTITDTPPPSHHSDELKRSSCENNELECDVRVKKPNLNTSTAMSSDDENNEIFRLEKSGDHFVNSPFPLDLSVDVLDLSKKKSNEECNERKISDVKDEKQSEFSEQEEEDEDEENDENVPQDLSKKSSEKKIGSESKPSLAINAESSNDGNNSTAKNDTPQLTSSLDPVFDKTVPKNILTNLYANNMNLNSHSQFLNSTSFPTFPATSFPPYFLPPPPFMFSPSTPELAAAKERWQGLMRGFQLTSGGSLVIDQMSVVSAADRFQALQQQALVEFNRQMETAKSESTAKPFSPLTKSPDQNISLPVKTPEHISNFIQCEKQPSEKIGQLSKTLKNDPSSSIKMVIKNGILIPKQKQRRYRTERPFTCEHCSARFTLRSNMERHIKQQHPQFWSQRQRGSNGSRGRGGYGKTSLYEQHSGLVIPFPPSYNQSNSVNSFNSSAEEGDSFGRQPSEKPGVDAGMNFQTHKTQLSISDEVKFAISKQLKTKFQLQGDKDNDDSDMNNENDESKDEEEQKDLVIDEEDTDKFENKSETKTDEKENEECKSISTTKKDESIDLASVSRLLDNASTQTFKQYFKADEDNAGADASDEEEEGLIAGSTSEGNISGSDENKSEPENSTTSPLVKKKSAYSLAPNKVFCPYCSRKFPWSSSLRRHVLTHTGQKPYKCPQCPLLFTTKSNCDRHLQRKHSSHGVNPETTTDANNKSNSALNFTTRNVPERPYKCKNCPSSTFSTLDNLRKHMSGKHNGKISENVSENDCKLDSSITSDCDNDQVRNSDGNYSGYESQGSGSEEIDVVKDSPESAEKSSNESSNYVPVVYPSILQLTLDRSNAVTSADHVPSTPGSIDLPFKCHLCDGSYAERHEALDHLRDRHASEFQLLLSKGALDANANANGSVNEENANIEENSTHATSHPEENLEQLRGRFPDYANRKVKCAFCLRRFWSAEDLRRHMRTHTGERPFSCDICRRKFTLKHSMLRHRKKHSLENSMPQNSLNDDHSVHSDDDNTLLNSKLALPIINHNNNNINSPFKSVFSNPLKFWKAYSAQANQKNLRSDTCDEGNDLIGNLLGIHDKSIIDKMLLSKSADDVAKLLGVEK